MSGSDVAENMSVNLCLPRSGSLLAMNATAELSMCMVIDPLMGSDLLEWGWHHLEDLNPDWFPIMTQSTKVD